MKQDKQTKQLIMVVVLGVALVGVLAYYLLFPGKTSQVQAKTNNATRTSIVSSDTGGKFEESISKVPNEIFPGLSVPAPRRDPFSTQYSRATQTKMPVNNASRVARMPSISMNSLKPFNPFKLSAGLPGIESVAVIAPERPVLNGVIMGQNNVAIIKHDGRTYVVNEGRFFAGRYRLLRVTNNSVVLQDRSTQIRIGLGGSK